MWKTKLKKSQFSNQKTYNKSINPSASVSHSQLVIKHKSKSLKSHLFSIHSKMKSLKKELFPYKLNELSTRR